MDLLVGGATLLLAAGTFWLAVETRNMAKTTKQMLEIDLQPELALRDVSIQFGDAAGELPSTKVAPLVKTIFHPV